MRQYEYYPDGDLNPVRSQQRVNKKQSAVARANKKHDVEINNPASSLASAWGSTGIPPR